MRVALFAIVLVACADSETVACGDLTCEPGSSSTKDGRCIAPGCNDGTKTETEVRDTTGVRCTDAEFYGYAGPVLADTASDITLSVDC